MDSTPGPLVHGLRWGLKASFVDYVRRMPDGRGAVGDGALPVGDGELFFELDRPLDSGDGWAFRGDVRFTGHYGMLFVRIARPHLVVADGTVTLSIEDPAGSPGAPRVPLVTGTLRPVESPAGTEVWVSEDVRLTAAGVELFNDVYTEGEPFEPLVVQVPAAAPRFARAIVVGGSIAGTLAAAAVARHFDEVLVLDRDELPDEAVFRKGVPQGAHFHALLAAGRKAMDELLPGFSERAFSLGAARLDSAEDVMRLDRVGWSPRFASGLEVRMASRPLIEKALRDRARQIRNVVYRGGTEVTGLVASDGRVTGVRAAGEELAADLVIDASGRFSRAPAWLEELGYPSPVESVVNAHWGYSSTFLRVPEDWDPGFQALAVQPFGQDAVTPEAATRAMAMWVVEGERRWILTVQGSAGDHPPRTEEALRAFTASIGVPEIDKALSEVEFPEKIAMWRDTRSRLRDYPAQADRPEGFLVVGDAWMGFNPVYGQGMTAAAIEAQHLQREIDAVVADTGALDGLPARFYASADTLIQYCWASSNTLDHRIPGVEVTVDGIPQEVDATSSDFSDRLAAYMAEDEQRYVRYRETTQLLRSPEWLQSDEVVNAVKERWDELGAAVVPR